MPPIEPKPAGEFETLFAIRFRTAPALSPPVVAPPTITFGTLNGEPTVNYYVTLPDHAFAPIHPHFRVTAAGWAAIKTPRALTVHKTRFLESVNVYGTRPLARALFETLPQLIPGLPVTELDQGVARDFDRLLADCLRSGLLEEVPLPSETPTPSR